MISSNRDDILFFSDFNTDVLAGLCANDDGVPQVNPRSAGEGPVIPKLLDGQAAIWNRARAAFVWTSPESVSETFLRASMMEPVDHEAALREVDVFCDAIVAASSRVATMFVATWYLPAEQRGYGMLDLQYGLGVRSLLARMNLRLTERLSGPPGIFVLDTARWCACREPFNAKMWYLAKVPFSNEVFKAAIGDVKSALRGVQGDARKIVICDLDDTLWGGIVGDVGWQNLRLGGHDAIGEALADVQHTLKALTRRGVILAIVSKNTESVALEAIQKHPEMVLRQNDFAGWRINWNDKAHNIADLLQELNLGLEAAVFLDDNPVERDRVRHALPEVLVPELPTDKRLYAGMLRRLDCFDTPVLSDEDRRRAAMYNADLQRRGAMRQATEVASFDDWLRTLQVKVQADPLDDGNRQRAMQLLNKTNQMNLATRRMSEAELVEWASVPHHKLWTFRVSDRFGDSGLAGIASLEVRGDVATLADYVLSCRVIGKGVEETIVHQLTESARALGAKRLTANYRPSQKNKPCLDFWQRSGFAEHGNHTFAWNLTKSYPKPAAVELIVNQGDA